VSGKFGGGCVVNCVSALSQAIFEVSVTKIDLEVKPDSIADDIWRESVSLIGIHEAILATSGT
jgi:hypothetical protein